MPGKYRAVIIGADDQVLERIKFPLCSEDTSAKNTIRSYAEAIFPAYKLAEVWNGDVKVAVIERGKS